jgi:hypothetical protein
MTDNLTEYLHEFRDDGAYSCLVCGENELVHRLARRAHDAEYRVQSIRHGLAPLMDDHGPSFTLQRARQLVREFVQ